jgi:hypothetical protein
MVVGIAEGFVELFIGCEKKLYHASLQFFCGYILRKGGRIAELGV